MHNVHVTKGNNFGFLTLLCCLLSLAGPEAASQQSPEERFRSIPDPALMRAYMLHLAARPHHVGSPKGKENAEWMLAQFRSWGFDARIETFHVLFPTPQERSLKLISPKPYTASLTEPAIPGDPDTDQMSEQLPPYNAYSIDGEVIAPLVYVNYGIPADYETLDRMGISVKGCIVIARYGASWRGIKPKLAAEKGAVGCIIYSDPRDDGYYHGETVPAGPYRNPDGVQRGSVMDMPMHPGDPLTPFIGATKDAKRLKKEDSGVLTSIPVLPISYKDAQPFLEALEGPVAPASWRGALPLTYRVGPGPAKVHLKLSFNWDIVPAHNVIAVMKGRELPDEWIIRGNHHDAWVNGAEDPTSGMIALLEEARAMGELVKGGWRPKRTLVYCAWDGEEQGLLGSTEWVEAHADELRTKAVLYINTDSNGRGFLGVGGSHALEPFINETAKAVTDPETGLSVWKRWQQRSIARGDDTRERQEARNASTLRIGALGSGSDYTAFFQHLGVPSLNIGFGGEGGGGIYHSTYDNVRWYTTWSDTGFVYGRALAQTAGTAVLRMSEAEVLPFDIRRLASTIGRYADEVKSLVSTKRDDIAETNRQIDEGTFFAVMDPRELSVPPAREALPPYLNFAPLENAVDVLKRSAEEFHKALEKARGEGKVDGKVEVEVNRLMRLSDQTLSHRDGLPRRPWFRHLVYAPGFYTGYGVKTLPGIREAIEQKNWIEAEKEIGRVAEVIGAFSRVLDSSRAQFQ